MARYERYSVVRQGKEVDRIVGVHHYMMDTGQRRITFYDEEGVVIKAITAEVGDVVKPVIIGFHSPFPPIDQSETRIQELTQGLA
jgi:hypothetical protein